MPTAVERRQQQDLAAQRKLIGAQARVIGELVKKVHRLEQTIR